MAIPKTDIAQGLWCYNSVLVAIAIGGIFYTPTKRRVLLAIPGATLCVPITRVVTELLPTIPSLTTTFVVSTWLGMTASRQKLPALMHVWVHAVVSPEEHRKRYLVASRLIKGFKRNLKT